MSSSLTRGWGGGGVGNTIFLKVTHSCKHYKYNFKQITISWILIFLSEFESPLIFPEVTEGQRTIPSTNLIGNEERGIIQSLSFIQEKLWLFKFSLNFQKVLLRLLQIRSLILFSVNRLENHTLLIAMCLSIRCILPFSNTHPLLVHTPMHILKTGNSRDSFLLP